MNGKLIINKHRDKGILVLPDTSDMISGKVLESDIDEDGRMYVSLLVHNLMFEQQNHVFPSINSSVTLTTSRKTVPELLENSKAEPDTYAYLTLDREYYFMCQVEIASKDSGYASTFDFRSGQFPGEGYFSGVLYITGLKQLEVTPENSRLIKNVLDGTKASGDQIVDWRSGELTGKEEEPKEEKPIKQKSMSKKEKKRARKLARAKTNQKATQTVPTEDVAVRAIYNKKVEPKEVLLADGSKWVRRETPPISDEETKTLLKEEKKVEEKPKIFNITPKTIDAKNMNKKQTRKERNTAKFPIVNFKDNLECYTWGQMTEDGKVVTFRTPANTTEPSMIIFANLQTAKFCIKYLHNNPSYTDTMTHVVPIKIAQFSENAIANSQGMFVKKGLSFVQSVFPPEQELVQEKKEEVDAT